MKKLFAVCPRLSATESGNGATTLGQRVTTQRQK